MGVENKGWIHGDGSMADAMFERMWSDQDRPLSLENVTEGPLAPFAPVEFDKSAMVIGGDNNPDSSTMPGGNRVIQKPTTGDQSVVHQTPETAKAPSAADSKKQVDSSPSKGSRGSEIMKRIRAARASKGDVVGEETATKSVGGEAKAPGHNLQVQTPAPVPKEFRPDRRTGNLPDYHERSAWTGSGPQAALHADYEKVGELLKIAGVPGVPLTDQSLFMRMAVSALSKESSGPDYFTRHDVHPLKLVAELSDTLGDEWTEWEPETIRESLVKEAGVEPSDDVMSKIMAVKIVLRRPDVFFDDWQGMEKISVALNDRAPAMGMVEEVPAEWLSNAVSIVTKIAGDGDFGTETTKYVAARLHDQGYVVAPPLLRFADSELGEMVGNNDLRKKVILAYARAVGSEDLDDEGEDPITIQVARLMRNNAYVLDRFDESRSQMS